MLNLDTVTEDELNTALSTRENVIAELESVRSPYNTLYFKDMDNTVDALLEAGKLPFAKQLRAYGRHICQIQIVIVKEYEKVTLVRRGADYGEYFLYHRIVDGKRPFRITSGYNLEDMLEIANSNNEIRLRGYEQVEVNIPSGELLFANWFMDETGKEYAYELPDDIRWKEENSINTPVGRENTMRHLSELFDLGYVQLGNTTAGIYKVSDDKIVIASPYEDELEILDNAIGLGTISCGVWRVEFIDKALAPNAKAREKIVPATVNAGRYIVKNYSQLTNTPIWVTIERVK